MACTSNPALPSTENSVDWLELPRELTASILVRLGAPYILLSARKVCKSWRQICSEPFMWQVVDMRNACNIYLKFEEAIRLAVDLSAGQLKEFSIDYFATDDLLLYIADRSSQLRRLFLDIEINACITRGVLCKILRKFPLLEELHLYHMRVSKQVIEVAGLCCPRLKSFKLINSCNGFPDNESALAIAGNMPGLHHLQLFGHKTTNDGLFAILENCPHLESLEMWLNVDDIKPDLVLRLCQQIKDVSVTYRSRKDYEYDDFDSLNKGLV